MCATPALTEIVFALGAGDRVVAVSEYAVHPPEALMRPKIGGWMDPNREQLLALRADLLLTQGEHPALTAFAEANRLPIQSIRIESLEDIASAVRALGSRLGAESEADALIKQMESARDRIRAAVSDRPPVRAALFMGRMPNSLQGLTTISRGTFLDDLLALAGGTNVFADAPGAYPQVSKESLLARNPQVIIEVNPGGWPPGALDALRKDWSEFGGLDAVRMNRMYFLDQNFLLIPGPRAMEIAALFSACLHPEIERP